MKKVIAKNKKAFHDYQILQELETGISLTGSEVKSIRRGEINLKGSYAIVSLEGQLILKQAHIKEYPQASYQNHEAKQDRILLAHKKEIHKLLGNLKKSRGTTLIPLEIYFKQRWIKVKLGLAIGKKTYDKRESIKEKEQKRDMDRHIKKSIF